MIAERGGRSRPSRAGWSVPLVGRMDYLPHMKQQGKRRESCGLVLAEEYPRHRLRRSRHLPHSGLQLPQFGMLVVAPPAPARHVGVNGDTRPEEGPKWTLPRVLSLARRRAVRVHVGRATGRRAALEVPGVAGVRVVAERGACGDSRNRKRAGQRNGRNPTSHLAHDTPPLGARRNWVYAATAGRRSRVQSNAPGRHPLGQGDLSHRRGGDTWYAGSDVAMPSRSNSRGCRRGAEGRSLNPRKLMGLSRDWVLSPRAAT